MAANRPSSIVEDRAWIMAGIAVSALVLGGGLHLGGSGAAGDDVWRAAVAVLAAELLFEVARTIVVERHMGVDTIALVAMVGALALGQELAGVVIGLMFSGGAAAIYGRPGRGDSVELRPADGGRPADRAA